MRMGFFGSAGLTAACIAGAAASVQARTEAPGAGAGGAPINGLIYLIKIDPEAETDGLLKWETELRARGLAAMIKASNPVLENYPAVFRRLAAEGHEIIGGYPGICWDMPYEDQYEAMESVKTYMESLTGKPIKVFACAYSSYHEDTLRAAEALGVPYVLARGTEDVRTLVCQPRNTMPGSSKCRTSNSENWGADRFVTSASTPGTRARRISRRSSRKA